MPQARPAFFGNCPDSASAREVSLADVLASRDERQARQRAWLARYQMPLISFTIIAPGAVKDNAVTREASKRGVTAIEAMLAAHHWPVAEVRTWAKPTGAEVFFSIQAPASDLKQAMVTLEDSAPIGRLWDIDVLDASGEILSRADFGLPPRKCLICDRPAAECARARRHSVPELRAKMEALLCL